MPVISTILAILFLTGTHYLAYDSGLKAGIIKGHKERDDLGRK